MAEVGFGVVLTYDVSSRGGKNKYKRRVTDKQVKKQKKTKKNRNKERRDKEKETRK